MFIRIIIPRVAKLAENKQRTFNSSGVESFSGGGGRKRFSFVKEVNKQKNPVYEYLVSEI